MSKRHIRNKTRGKKKNVPVARQVRVGTAELDSTVTNARVAEYYADAVNEAAGETLDQYTRETAQARGVHEFLNDPAFFGACRKIAALTLGTGAALKIDGPAKGYGEPGVDDVGAKAQYLERQFRRFAGGIDLLADCRLLLSELLYYGEAFVRKTPSRGTVDGYDYAFLRPERVATPPGLQSDPRVFDGIVYDRDDDAAAPVGYYVLKERVNPQAYASIEYEYVPVGEIVHVYERFLPQQRRGVPEVQAALGLIRELKLIRNYEIQAVKKAAQTAVILHTDAPEIVQPWAEQTNDAGELEILSGRLTSTLPDGVFVCPPGYDPVFGDSKHPASGYEQFKRILTADVGATLGVGSGKINNDHSPYNFSSAKMDEQIDAPIVRTRQAKIASSFLDVVFNDWLLEFAARDAVADEFLTEAGCPENVDRRWLFPQPRSIDRLKDAQADEIELRLGTKTREQILAERGLDAEEVAARQLEESRQQRLVGGQSDNEQKETR